MPPPTLNSEEPEISLGLRINCVLMHFMALGAF